MEVGEIQRCHRICDDVVRSVCLYFNEKCNSVETSLVLGILRSSLLDTLWVAEEQVCEILQF